MKRAVILGSIIGTGLLAIQVFGQAPGPGAEKIEKVAENLYRIPGGGGNAAVWVRADGVLLVDTKLPNNGQKLLDLIRSVTDKPITHIVNTHTHGDHTGSNAYFPASVDVIAQANTAANMQKMDNFKSPEGAVGLPDHTFKDRMTLFKGKERVELYYFGASHTDGDTLVVFPAVRVMHAGDMFATKGLPLIDTSNGGSGVAYGATIARAAAAIKGVDAVITGHSDVMTWQDFIDYGEFNRVVLAQVRAEQKAGHTAQEAQANLKLPEKFKGYNLGSNGNPALASYNAVVAIYRELGGG